MAFPVRIDMLFSTWIFVWFLLYVGHIATVTPKFALVVACVHNAGMLAWIVSRHAPPPKVLRFLATNAVIKILPLYLVWRDPVTMITVYWTLALFGIYLVWLHVQKESYWSVYDRMLQHLVSKE